MTEDHQPLIGDAVFTDGPGLLIVVEKLPEANTVEVTDALEDAIDDLAPGLAGIDVDTSFFQPARYVEDSHDNLRTAPAHRPRAARRSPSPLLLFDLRAAFVAVAGILVSLAAAVARPRVPRGDPQRHGARRARARAVRHHRRRGDHRRRRTAARARRGAWSAPSSRVRGPLGLRHGHPAARPRADVRAGRRGRRVPAAVRALLRRSRCVASLVVALTVHAGAGVARPPRSAAEARTSPVFGWLRRRLDRRSSRFARGPRTGLVVAALLLLARARRCCPFLERGDSIVPEFKDRDLLIQWSGAPGTSLPEMQRIAARAGNELRALPGVDNVGGHVGRAVLGDQIVGVNSSELWVRIESVGRLREDGRRDRGRRHRLPGHRAVRAHLSRGSASTTSSHARRRRRART